MGGVGQDAKEEEEGAKTGFRKLALNEEKALNLQFSFGFLGKLEE